MSANNTNLLSFDGFQVDPKRPTDAWRNLSPQQSHQVIAAPRLHDGPSVRIVCISDTHCKHAQLQIPDGDILIHAGDISSVGHPHQLQRFVDWLTGLPHRHKIVIAGNHDLTLDKAYYERSWQRFHYRSGRLDDDLARQVMTNQAAFHYLVDEEICVAGIRVYGSPWQPQFFDWAFNLERGKPCALAWKKIPAGVDIVVTHGPPLGHGDQTSTGQRAGCVNLLHEIQYRIQPKYHVFGHIHEGYGVTTDGTTTYVNASSCTLKYVASNPPIVFDIQPNL